MGFGLVISRRPQVTLWWFTRSICNRVTVGEETDVLTSFGPLQTDDLSSGKGLVSDAPFFELKEAMVLLDRCIMGRSEDAQIAD